MLRRFAVSLAAGLAALALSAGAQAHGAPPPGPPLMPPASTPTTRILAIGTIVPGADLRQVLSTLPAEMRATAQLYLDGKIDQWFSQENRNGVVFILNLTDLKQAQEMLERLPLGQAHLMRFELIPIGPLKPLRQLLGPPPAPRP